MEQATPVQVRRALEAVEAFKKSGIRFVPIPCKNDKEEEILVRWMMSKLKRMEKDAEE